MSKSDRKFAYVVLGAFTVTNLLLFLVSWLDSMHGGQFWQVALPLAGQLAVVLITAVGGYSSVQVWRGRNGNGNGNGSTSYNGYPPVSGPGTYPTYQPPGDEDWRRKFEGQ